MNPPPKFLFSSISVHFGIGATIRTRRESQCLPYAGFFGIGASIRACQETLSISRIQDFLHHTTKKGVLQLL